CRTPFRQKDIEVLGLAAHKGRVVPSVDLLCAKCGQPSRTVFRNMPMTPQQFAEKLLQMPSIQDQEGEPEVEPHPQPTTHNASNPSGPHLLFVGERPPSRGDRRMTLFGGYVHVKSGVRVLLYSRWRPG